MAGCSRPCPRFAEGFVRRFYGARDAKTLATGVVLTLIMGGLGGAVPALSAMRLTPLEALR